MSVPLSEPAALRARLRRVRRRDEGHRHAGGQGLVRDKPLELVERPVVPVQPRIGCRRPPLPGPRPDPGEVFEPDSGPIPDGQGDNLFAETVVDMSDSLFSRAARALRFPFFWRERRARTCCWRRALIRPVLKNTTGPSGGTATAGTFCPRSTPTHRPVLSGHGTSMVAERQAYQTPLRERYSLSEPLAARPSRMA